MIKKYNIWYCHPFGCSPDFGNKIANRPYFFAKEWSKKEHRTVLIGSSYEHLGGFKTETIQKNPMNFNPNINYLWLETPKYKGNGLNRIRNSLAYANQLKNNALNIVNSYGSPDIIICSSPHPFHYKACKKIANRFNAKLISEIRDLWPLSLIELLGVYKFHPLCLWLNKIETDMCRNSDMVVSLLENAYEYLKNKGLDKKRFTHIPNGYCTSIESFDTDTFEKDEDYIKLSKFRENGNFIIGYNGAHGEPNRLRIICEAIKSINNSNIKLILIGTGNIKNILVEKYIKVENIHFFDPKPRESIHLYQKLFNIAYWCLDDKPIFNYGLSPNKLYEYCYRNLVVLTPYKPSPQLLQRTKNTLYFENNNLESLIKTINLAYSMPNNDLKNLGNQAQKVIKENYLISKLAQDYIKVFNKIA